MSFRLTPLMNQYREIKSRHGDGILFFQVGDFYETFYDDAREVSRLLNIALTTRDKDKDNPVPLAGVPIHAAEAYIAKLLQLGRKVVICDQADDVPGASGVVKRIVSDVVTPGTTIAPATLVERENNYIVSLLDRDAKTGFAILDVSTGEFSAGEDSMPVVAQMLAGARIREAVIPDGSGSLLRMIADLDSGATIDARPPFQFEERTTRDTLLAHFGVANLACFGLEDKPLAAAAAGALLALVKELRHNQLLHITELKLLVSGDSLFLDLETLRNLEVFEPQRGNASDTTLIHHMDRTETAAGGRELRKWLMHPSRRIDAIRRRLDAISSLTADHTGLRAIRAALRRFPDVERLLSRIAARKAGPRELLALADALERAPAIAEAARRFHAAALREAAADLSTQTGALDIISRGIDAACPPHLRDGGVIQRGYRDDLDLLIKESEEGKTWIAHLQESERERTGIPSLKVGYNRVFGYYIEVSRANDSRVPGDYVAKQTLVSSQRYVTRELKEREQTILTADTRRIELEREIFDKICEDVSRESESIQMIAAGAAVIDVLCALADVAVERSYCRPEINEGDDLVITEGRHPVVEIISGKNFIPNDIDLRLKEKSFMIITGPNMGGKSTYIRQAALIALLAHAGSFVPAARASVGLLDRIFTRVGSSDNLARGQSTFLVEMAETAKILHNCTDKSLVILDEIGRGTSTLDGLSLAWAVSEFLLGSGGCRPKTLFATHYHELTRLTERFPNARNLRVEVREWGEGIIFLYKICEGASDKSYGIHVARLAGFPEAVIHRAKEILEALEKEQAGGSLPQGPPAAQVSLFEPPDALRDRLHSIDIDSITPLNALKLLADLKRMTKD
ncbi:MAG: DNA mismatch repair protein MutS [Candidatus Krumholzibacteria bacterium]|nr:DNA mismatch repair protein MutS [Candidatus Krumholzibacteria bacterium]